MRVLLIGLTQVPFSPQVEYEIKDPSSGLQAALQTVSRKSDLKFPGAVRALKSPVTDAVRGSWINVLEGFNGRLRSGWLLERMMQVLRLI